jgi:catechol 2,3-dioxygenase-like lactoylglutathione lyase family enzyme
MEKEPGVEFVFAHVHLKSRNFDAAKAFYEKMFHARFLFEEKVRNARVAMMELGGTFLHISEVEAGETIQSPKEPRKNIWTRYGLGHFGFKVKDLDAAVRELKQKGAEFVGGIRDIREGVRVIYMRAPDDDVIEISERSASFEALLRP